MPASLRMYVEKYVGNVYQAFASISKKSIEFQRQ